MKSTVQTHHQPQAPSSECLSRSDLQWIATVIQNGGPPAQLLQRPTNHLGKHLLDCLPCRVRLQRELGRRDDQRAEQLASDTHVSLADLIQQGNPRFWPAPTRWPEVEAVAERLQRIDPRHARRQLSTLLRELLTSPDPTLKQAGQLRQYLRSRVPELWDPRERVAWAFVAGNAEEEAAALRECALASDTEEAGEAHSKWEVAAQRVERLAPSGLSEFRRRVHQALSRLLGDQLTPEVVHPLLQAGWDGVAIYLPDASGRALEAVAASDETLVYAVRHPIVTSTPDIEVDTFRKQVAERILDGRWDERYSPSLYRDNRHKLFHDRGFFPLSVARDPNDCSIVEPCEWASMGALQWRARAPEGLVLQSVGSMSISRRERIDDAAFREALNFVSSKVALCAHQASLHGFCETLLALLIQRFGAQHGALHFGTDPDSVFLAPAAAHSPHVRVHVEELGGVAEIPRRDGIGAEAIARGECIHVHGDRLRLRNRKLWDKRVRLTSAAPLINAEGQVMGVIYLHFDNTERAADVTEFVREIGYALGLALTAQRRVRLTPNVLAEARTFARPPTETLPERLQRLTEFSLNFMGADHISIALANEHLRDRLQSAGRYVRPLETPARHEAQRRLKGHILNLPLPKSARYISNWSEVPSDHPYKRGQFVHDEGIEATAVLPLVYEQQPVGLLIIDYRSEHDFQSEREVLETLAGLLAAGIQAFLTPDRKDEVSETAEEKLLQLSSASARFAGLHLSKAIRVGFEGGRVSSGA